MKQKIVPCDGMTDQEMDEMQMLLGGMLLRLPLMAKLLRHDRVEGPIRGNYLKSSEQNPRAVRVATEFLNDILIPLSTEEMLAKWYPDGAERMLLALMPPAMNTPAPAPSNPKPA